MTIGSSYVFTNRDSGSISLTSVNRKTNARSEAYLNRRLRILPDFYFYDSSYDGGRELRLSARWLWFSVNLFICFLAPRENGHRFDDRDGQWGWYFLDHCLKVGFGKKMPGWELPFITTECEGNQIMSLNRNRVVFGDRRPDGKRKDFLGTYDERQKAINENSATYDYCYELDNGEKQHVKATVHVTRYLRRWKWTPFVKNDDGIWVEFSEEVGPERGSWKGGCTGCGWTLRKNETARECLRRMEQERRFER